MFTIYCVNNFMMYVSQIIMVYTSNSNTIPVNKTEKEKERTTGRPDCQRC